MPAGFRLLIAVAALAWATSPATADEVSDTIQSALDAYNEGDTAYATRQLDFALQLLNDMQAGDMQSFLPEPLDGWTREIDTDPASIVNIMGGTGALASYTSDNATFTIALMMDSPMVAAMAPLLSNPTMAAASGGRIVPVGREQFVSLEGDLNGLVGGRVFIQAGGEESDSMVAHLETMDFRALSQFGL